MKTKAKSGGEGIQKVYLFSGEVDARRQQAVDELVAKLVDAGSAAFDLERFEGDAASADNVLSSVATVPLMSERKVVIVNRVDRMSADDQGKIASFLPKLGPRSCLILLAEGSESGRSSKKADEDEGEEDQKKHKKGLQAGLTKAVKAEGSVVSFAKMKSDSLSALISKSAEGYGKKLEGAALAALTRALASTPAMIDSELAKLAAYTADRKVITLRDVDDVATKSPEDRVFPLIDAIAARQPGQAVQLLSETFAASAKPDGEVLKIVSLMARHFRMLYQAKFLRTQGVRGLMQTPEDLQAMLPQDKKQTPLGLSDWQQKKLMQQTNAFALDELQDALKQILACELAVKGIGKGEGSPRLNLEMLVVKLSQRKNHRTP